MRHAPPASKPAAAGGVNLRTLLRALPLLGTLPMLVFALALLWQQWSMNQDAMHHLLERTTQGVARSVERDLNGSLRQLELITQIPSLQTGQLPAFHDYLERVVQSHAEWDNLVLLDRQGMPLLDAKVPVGMPMPRSREVDQFVARMGPATVSDLYISTYTGRPAVVAMQPVQRDGGTPWVLVGRIADTKLRRLLYEPTRDTALMITVVDGNGRVVARSRDFDRFFGTPFPPDMLRLVRSRPQGMEIAHTAGGPPFLMAWRRLENGWTVSAGVDPVAQEAPLRDSLIAAGGAGVVLLLLGVVGASWVARRIGTAVDQAAEDAMAMARGEPVQATRSQIAQIDRMLAAHDEASRRLAQGARERSEALDRMYEEVRRRDAFLSMMAHELRNPLAPLVHALWLIERCPHLDAPARRRLGVAAAQARQLNRLVDDLLEASRLVNGKITLRPEHLEMRELVAQSAEAMRPLAEGAGHQLIVEVPNDPVTLVADGERIRQVLHNLLGNALKFSRAEGLVRVTLQATDQEAVVSVSDTGIGIDPQRLEELFLPFSQIDPGMDRAKGGLGLGLTIARQLVQMHGGTLHAHSAGLGLGATFTMRLPRQASEAIPAANADIGGSDGLRVA